MVAESLPVPRIGRLGFGALLVFALGFPTAYTWLYFVALGGQPASQAVFAVCKLVQFTLPLWSVRLLVGRWPRLAPPTGRGLIFGAGFGLVVGAAILGLYFGVLRGGTLLANGPSELREKLTGLGVATTAGFLALALFYSFLHSGLEEYYWRWFVFGKLLGERSVVWGVVVSSLGFMAHHVVLIGVYMGGYGGLTWFFSAGVAVGGAVWAWMFRRFATVYAPWLSHLLVDAALMTVGYAMWRDGI